MILSTNSTERMQIDSAGNVGIGTASPTTKLDILSNSASLTGLSVSPHSSGLTATITAAVQSGGTVTYTATNTFTAGQQVTITGITPTTYNVNNVTIKTATGSNFTIATATLGGTYVSGGTATAYANLQEWQTNAGTQLSAISQNGAFSSSSTETIIENSGDTFGTTRLRLQNRGGQAGPLFEQAGTVDVVDFGFKIPSSQSLIRYEGRYGSQFSANPVTSTNGPEFQFGNASTTTQGATVGTWFPLVVGAGLLDKRVQINSTTGNNTALTIKAIPTKTATITGATVTTFTNKSGTIVIPQAVSASFSRITGIASTTGLLAGMTLTYVSGTGTFGGGTATIISVDSSTAITVYTTAVAVAGATVFSIQNSVTYTATNAFSQTHGVTITGATAAGLNVAGATIGAVTGSTFTIINTTASGTWSSGGIATITQTTNLTDWIGSADTSIASISAEGNLTANQFIASNNGNGTNFKVGDDVWIGDINIANTMSVRGAQSAASGFIRFGSDTNALGYNGTAFSYGGAMTATSFNSITGFPVSGTPAMNGSASLGSATTTSRSDHIHPTDTSRAAVGQTMYIGTTAVAINRSTASLSLTGVSINGNAGTVTNGIYTTTTSLPNVTSVNGTTIPSAATLLTSGGALGTPSGGTLTNAIGLPISGLVASTTTAIGVGSIELGHATDTTIARVSAGVVSIEGNNILTAASTASALTSTGTITSGTWSGSFGAVSGANLTSLTAANISSGTLGSGVVPTQGTTTSGASGLGYMGMPQNVNPGSVSIQATDAGKHLYYTTTGQTLTIPAATALALPIGFTFTVINAAAVRTTIAITTDTMYLAGTGATGSRTLVPYGMATAVKVSGVSSAGVWMISGSGLT